MIWLNNKNIIFLLHTFNLSPGFLDDMCTKPVLKINVNPIFEEGGPRSENKKPVIWIFAVLGINKILFYYQN